MLHAHMRIAPPVDTGTCRRATTIVEASAIEPTSERPRVWRPTIALFCVLLVASAATLFSVPRGDRAAGALAAAVGSLAIQDGHGDIATMLVRPVVVEVGDGKRLPADGPRAMLPPSDRGVVPDVSAHVRVPPVSRPCIAAAGLLESNRIPTGPPVA